MPTVETITCHSNRHRFERCNIHGWDDARVLRQVSDAPCVRGTDWGIDGEWLWVTDGCRAEFAEVRWPRRTERRVNLDDTRTCASKNDQPKRCQVGLWQDAELIEQYSRSACVRGRTWGLEGTAIWVDNGCRGKFAQVTLVEVPVRPAPRGPVRRVPHRRGRPLSPRAAATEPAHAVRFTCQSRDQKYHYCRVRIGNGSVSVAEKLSSADCTRGQSWGWDRNGIWVQHGCRAHFLIHRPD